MVKFPVLETVFVLRCLRRPQDFRQCVAEVHSADFAPLGRPYFGLVPCAVVPHTAAYRQVLLVQIDVLPCQAADLANAKPRVVGDLYGQQRRVFPVFQIAGQLQVLPVGDGRSGNRLGFLPAEDVRFLFPPPQPYILHRVEGNQPLREHRKAERPLQHRRELEHISLAHRGRDRPVRVCAAVAHKVKERLQMVGCDGFQPAASYRVFPDLFDRRRVRHDRPVAQAAGL